MLLLKAEQGGQMLEFAAIGTFGSLSVAIVALFSLMNDEPVRLGTKRAVRRAWWALFASLTLAALGMISFFFITPN